MQVLRTDGVDVCWSRVDGPPDPAALLALRPFERARAAASVAPSAHDGYVAGRLLLRRAAARALGADLDAVVVEAACPHCGAADHGVPRVRAAAGTAAYASLARAGALVAAVVSEAHPVGLDVERRGRVGADVDAVALTGPERATVDALPDAEQDDARTRLWVRKEAVLKLRGTGLRVDPRTVDVRLDEVPGLGAGETAGGVRGPVRLTDLVLGADHVGALAVPAPPTAGVDVSTAPRPAGR